MALSAAVVVDGQERAANAPTPPLVDHQRRQSVAEVERQGALGRAAGQVRRAVPRVGPTVPAVRLNDVVVAGFHVVVAYRSDQVAVRRTTQRRLTAVHVH